MGNTGGGKDWLGDSRNRNVSRMVTRNEGERQQERIFCFLDCLDMENY